MRGSEGDGDEERVTELGFGRGGFRRSGVKPHQASAPGQWFPVAALPDKYWPVYESVFIQKLI